MASASNTFSGNEGPKFRATVDMTRTYSGTAAQNYETWTITGYVDKTSTSGLDVTYSRPDAYYYLGSGTYQAGEDASGNVAISWANTVGRKFTTAINNMTIERQQDGSTFSTTAEFYFYAGFVGVNECDVTLPWNTNAVPRAATITSATTNFYETENPTITFTTQVPSFPVDILLQLNDSPTYTNVATRTNITSPYTIVLTNAERDAIRAAIPNSNTVGFTYYLKTNDGSFYGISTTYAGGLITIDNRGGIASPTFTTWAVTDTTSAVAATSGGNPVMVQGKSVARATVTAANKGVAIKSATMSSYSLAVGSTTQPFSYSSGSTVTGDVDLATTPTTSGSTTMSVSAIDSRTNSTSVGKSVLVLPYANPIFYPTIKIAYTNRFDTSGGLSVTLPSGTNLVSFSPLNTGGTDYNVINTTSGVQYQLHKNTISGGNPWYDIPTATVTGSGVQTTTAATLATDILAKMIALGADNSVNWYVTLGVKDKYNPTTRVTSQITIDIGAPIFRIGVDGNVYNNEKRILTVGDYTPDGWTTMVTNPDVITSLGQHSYTVRYPNVDYSTTIAKGTRLKLNRGTAAPTVSAGLNGGTMSFRRVSPNGMTFTDNFTCSAWIKLKAYPASGNECTIISRFNGTSGWYLSINLQGLLQMVGVNGSVFEYGKSYEAIPLNKWVHVAATLNIAGTACTMYIDGNSIPVAYTNSAITALAQAGNLEIGAANGGVNLFNGNIAQAAVYSAVLSQSTIRDSMNQTLTGSETNLISAYTLSSSVTDLKGATGNNLSVIGSVVASTDAPFAQGSGAIGTAGVSEYGIVTNVSYSSPNTTLTVQTPENSVLPVTGSIASSAYSIQRAPIGFPASRMKWRISSVYLIAETVVIGAVNQFSVATSAKLTVPIGDWELAWQGEMQQSSSASGTRSFFVTLFDSTPANIASSVVPPNLILTQRAYINPAAATILTGGGRVSTFVSLAAQTTYNMYGGIDSASGTETWSVRGDQTPVLVTADNAYL